MSSVLPINPIGPCMGSLFFQEGESEGKFFPLPRALRMKGVPTKVITPIPFIKLSQDIQPGQIIPSSQVTPPDELLTDPGVIEKRYIEARAKAEKVDAQREKIEITETRGRRASREGYSYSRAKRGEIRTHSSRSRSPKKHDEKSRSRSPRRDDSQERKDHCHRRKTSDYRGYHGSYHDSSYKRSSDYSSDYQTKDESVRRREIVERPAYQGEHLTSTTSKISYINPQEVMSIRFSQMTIDSKIRGGESIQDLMTDIVSNGWREDCPIEIVEMPDGVFTSLDNRRLQALKLIGEYYPDSYVKLKITVIKHRFDEIADPLKVGQITTRVKEMDAEESERIYKEVDEIIKKNPNLTFLNKKSFGYLVLIRMYGLTGADRSFLKIDKMKQVYGFTTYPIEMTSQNKRQHMYAAWGRSALTSQSSLC